MAKTLTENKIRINFELSKELFEKLRKKAAEEELTYSAYLRQLIKKAVEQYSLKKKVNVVIIEAAHISLYFI